MIGLIFRSAATAHKIIGWLTLCSIRPGAATTLPPMRPRATVPPTPKTGQTRSSTSVCLASSAEISWSYPRSGRKVRAVELNAQLIAPRRFQLGPPIFRCLREHVTRCRWIRSGDIPIHRAAYDPAFLPIVPGPCSMRVCKHATSSNLRLFSRIRRLRIFLTFEQGHFPLLLSSSIYII